LTVRGDFKVMAGDQTDFRTVFKFGSGLCPERVWAVLTNPEMTSRFLFGIRLCSTWELGSTLTGWVADIAVVWGEVLFSGHPNRLSYVLAAGAEQPEVYITWDVQECGTGAVVLLQVDEPDTCDAVVEASWLPVITTLQALLSADPT
jgi:hypothetical protein